MRNNKTALFIVWLIVLFMMLTGCRADISTDSGNINSQEIISV